MAESRSRRSRNIAVGVGLALVAVLFVPTPATAATGTTTRVSVASDGSQVNGRSSDPEMSADGRYVAFSSKAPNLVPGDTNDAFDVFVRDRQAGTTARVSVASDGTQAEPAPRSHPGRMYSVAAAISADGRYVAFQSNAHNLVSDDNNAGEINGGEGYDVFVHDRQTATTERVSLNSIGVESNGNSKGPDISADGRYVAFESLASNLVCRVVDAAPIPACDPTNLDTNGNNDVFVRDRLSGTTTRVSVANDGTQATGHSQDAAISADGGHVSFSSRAANLVTGDTNARDDVFVHDRQTATTTRVSLKSDGTQAENGAGLDSDISGDGRHVVFASYASNLVDGDTNQAYDVFLHDRQTATTTRVSVTGSGKQAKSDSHDATISADGRYVAFESNAPNLVPGDTNGYTDIFVRDLQAGTTTRVNVASDGTQPEAAFVGGAAISADGRYVAFDSTASNLVPGDTNGTDDVFIRDTIAPPLVSVGDASVQEGAAGTRAVFTVSLSEASTYDVTTVNYATAKGTATGADFTAKSGTLSFAPGTTTLTIKIAITPDTLVEGTETFSVKLSGASGATIADGIGVGTIIDND